jgi:uncharacterized protein (TIGR03435 family)
MSLRWLPALLSTCMWAQPAPPAFAVASIKLNKSLSETMGGGIFKGRADLRNRTLENLIEMAYRVDGYRISGGPGWLRQTRYDIEASPAAPVGHDQALLMLRTLLEDRFRLRLHHRTDRMQGYILVVDKGGSKLPVSKESTEGFHLMSMEEIRGAASLSMFAGVLKGILGAPVEDDTHLAGKYDFELKWKADNSAEATTTASEPELTIFTAIKQQLGLALKPAKVAVDMIVVDSAERTPTEN